MNVNENENRMEHNDDDDDGDVARTVSDREDGIMHTTMNHIHHSSDGDCHEPSTNSVGMREEGHIQHPPSMAAMMETNDDGMMYAWNNNNNNYNATTAPPLYSPSYLPPPPQLPPPPSWSDPSMIAASMQYYEARMRDHAAAYASAAASAAWAAAQIASSYHPPPPYNNTVHQQEQQQQYLHHPHKKRLNQVIPQDDSSSSNHQQQHRRRRFGNSQLHQQQQQRQRQQQRHHVIPRNSNNNKKNQFETECNITSKKKQKCSGSGGGDHDDNLKETDEKNKIITNNINNNDPTSTPWSVDDPPPVKNITTTAMQQQQEKGKITKPSSSQRRRRERHDISTASHHSNSSSSTNTTSLSHHYKKKKQKKFRLNTMNNHLSSSSISSSPRPFNPVGKTGVSALYELCDKKHWEAPQFVLSEEESFVMIVKLHNQELGRGRGGTKASAKQDAARRALVALCPGIVFDRNGIVLDIMTPIVNISSKQQSRQKRNNYKVEEEEEALEQLVPNLALRLAINNQVEETDDIDHPTLQVESLSIEGGEEEDVRTSTMEHHQSRCTSPDSSISTSVSIAASLSKNNYTSSAKLPSSYYHSSTMNSQNMMMIGGPPFASILTPSVETAEIENNDDDYYAKQGASVCSALLHAMAQIDGRIQEPPSYTILEKEANQNRRSSFICEAKLKLHNQDTINNNTSTETSTDSSTKEAVQNESADVNNQEEYDSMKGKGKNVEDSSPNPQPVALTVLEGVGTGATKREARHVASAKLLALLFPDCNGMVEVKQAAENAREKYATSKRSRMKRTSVDSIIQNTNVEAVSKEQLNPHDEKNDDSKIEKSNEFQNESIAENINSSSLQLLNNCKEIENEPPLPKHVSQRIHTLLSTTLLPGESTKACFLNDPKNVQILEKKFNVDTQKPSNEENVQDGKHTHDTLEKGMTKDASVTCTNAEDGLVSVASLSLLETNKYKKTEVERCQLLSMSRHEQLKAEVDAAIQAYQDEEEQQKQQQQQTSLPQEEEIILRRGTMHDRVAVQKLLESQKKQNSMKQIITSKTQSETTTNKIETNTNSQQMVGPLSLVGIQRSNDPNSNDYDSKHCSTNESESLIWGGTSFILLLCKATSSSRTSSQVGEDEEVSLLGYASFHLAFSFSKGRILKVSEYYYLNITTERFIECLKCFAKQMERSLEISSLSMIENNEVKDIKGINQGRSDDENLTLKQTCDELRSTLQVEDMNEIIRFYSDVHDPISQTVCSQKLTKETEETNIIMTNEFRATNNAITTTNSTSHGISLHQLHSVKEGEDEDADDDTVKEDSNNENDRRLGESTSSHHNEVRSKRSRVH